MNCPSRTDETPLHPGWNQNPPFLPADLTTREDLNGIVNARRYRNPNDDPAEDCTRTLDKEMELDKVPPDPVAPRVADAQLPLCYRDEVCSANPRFSKIPRNYTRLFGSLYYIVYQCQQWIWPSFILALFPTIFHFMRNSSYPDGISSLSQKRTTRSSTCASGGASGDSYNTPLHIGAVMIILFVSTTACAFPMLVIRFPRLHIPSSFLFTVRHFGTGVLIATAFVHLLPTAFISLGDPCLSDFWTTDYPAMPGAIALAAVFLVSLVEMVFSAGGHMCGNTEVVNEAVASSHRHRNPTDESEAIASRNATNGDDNDAYDYDNNDNEKNQGTVANRPNMLHRNSSRRAHDPVVGRTTSIGRGLAQMSMDAARYDQIERTAPERLAREDPPKTESSQNPEVVEGLVPHAMTADQKRKKALLQCVLLEMGILFHSIFIGMALSVSVGNEFVILLIAITFHQLFEGLALGARIAALTWESKALQPWLMALAYGCTTPLGQAIGLGTHTLYSPDSEVGLIMVGVMNAISAGLLVYASLVELLSEDFLSDESWRLLRGKRRVFACILVFLGAVGMSLIGAWA